MSFGREMSADASVLSLRCVLTVGLCSRVSVRNDVLDGFSVVPVHDPLLRAQRRVLWI